jgi:hypothetical protein
VRIDVLIFVGCIVCPLCNERLKMNPRRLTGEVLACQPSDKHCHLFFAESDPACGSDCSRHPD